MPQKQRQSLKMTVGRTEIDDDGEAAGTRQNQRHQTGAAASTAVPPRPIRITSYLSSSTVPPMQQQHHTTRQTQLGSKDLIIRMLAEIFQVGPDENGQDRWQQVSTSLVPISLYSRTTSKWLDYLLAASSSIQANDPANTMSPDSRDFLLLLQQFHQQTPRLTSRTAQQFSMSVNTSNNLDTNRLPQDCIVFQVGGHDFIDGQCRKILNVKIRQPGTRLGQASDYFVYWKEQTGTNQMKHHSLYHQQFSASSFASSASNAAAPSPMRTAQMLNPSFIARLNDQAVNPNEQPQQTWGLNFASINDAKLFYDICSLNLVDLDFNSDYLKQLAISDRRQPASNQKASMTPVSPCSLMLNQRRSHHHHHQQQQQPQPQPQQFRNIEHLHQQQQRILKNRASQKLKQQQSQSARDQHQVKQLLHGSSPLPRCQACKQSIDMEKQRQSSIKNNTDTMSMMSNSCPVHGNNPINYKRTRSRSTTRQLSTTENGILVPSRSFSTPASPEPDQCPVHRRRRQTETECEQQPGDDQQRTLKFLKKQQSRQLAGSIKQNKSAQDGVRPDKPVRGHLRSSYLLSSQESSNSRRQQQSQHAQAPPVPQHQNSVTSDRALHTKKNTKTRYMGYLHNMIQQQERTESRKQIPIEHSHNSDNVCPDVNDNDFQTSATDNFSINRSLLQRIQAGTETFDSIARRDARLARARYANSRNTKEFLSLDVGGLQSAMPTQQRFQRKQSCHQNAGSESGSGRQPSEFLMNTSGLVDIPAAKSTNNSRQVNSGRKVPAKTALQQLVQSDDGGQGPSIAIGDDRGSMSDANVGPGSARTLATHRLEASDSVRCNVSTSTEDLPMDFNTRKRMLKLTSEEVISERTEPKSLSTSAPMEQEQPNKEIDGRQIASREEKSDRQVRAVSLGPGLGTSDLKIRGRGARSDAGRRRSLERSVCVDFDPTLPASSIMKFSRLSPLLQSSTSPLAPEGGGVSSKNSAPYPGPLEELSPPIPEGASITNSNNAHHYGLDHSANHSDRLAHLYKKSARSSKVESHQFQANRDYADDGDNAGFVHFRPANVMLAQGRESNGNCSRRQMSSFERQLVMFKSAPDMRRIDDLMYDLSDTHFENPEDECDDGRLPAHRDYKQQQQHFISTSKTTAPRGKSNLSSYAVPLCTTVKRPPQPASMRQCHSCPSSLRRKRRPISTDSDLDLDDPNICMVDLPSSLSHNENYCSCQNCSRKSSTLLMRRASIQNKENVLGGRCACCEDRTSVECPDCFAIYGDMVAHDNRCRLKQLRQRQSGQQLSQPCCQHYNIHHHQHQSKFTGGDQHRDTMNFTRRAIANSQQHRTPVPRVDGFTPQQHSSRPHSSQSIRSPTHYGLYESDCDDDMTALPMHHFSESIEGYGNDSCNRSQSAYFRSKTAATSAAAFKPVQGYDQTMDRASLKSRQRSRSQPPSNSTEVKSAFHLTKSMENVEKLIKEVQNELRALKRQPLGTAQIDLKARAYGTDQTAVILQDASATQRNSSFKADTVNGSNNENKNPLLDFLKLSSMRRDVF